MIARRLLLVHAHPDDESIMTGATMAHYVRQGVPVTLVTCTLGEEGEILVPELAGLAAGCADQLGGYRVGELTAAMLALGVTDHRFLGGAGRFRDSGMAGAPANDHPRAFWRAAQDPGVFAAAVADLVTVIREVRPGVVVTYDDNGGYGHPDHVMAHRVTVAAIEAAADRSVEPDEAWTVDRMYATADPVSTLQHDAAVVAAADVAFDADAARLDFGVADGAITTVLDASACVAPKRAALVAHRTQVTVEGGFYALSNNIGRVVSGVESFRRWPLRAGADRAPGRVESGPVEIDLFAEDAR